MKIAIIGLVLSTSLVFVSCKKTVDELPPATQTGANTFGARVNGEFWVPAGFGVAPTAPLLEARYIDNSFVINARNFSSSPTETEFELYIRNVTGPGHYPLNTPTQIYPNQGASYGYYVKRRFTPENEWITNASYTGFVEITKFDTENRIVSGNFVFNAINLYGTPEPLTVTDGRFDLRY